RGSAALLGQDRRGQDRPRLSTKMPPAPSARISRTSDISLNAGAPSPHWFALLVVAQAVMTCGMPPLIVKVTVSHTCVPRGTSASIRGAKNSASTSSAGTVTVQSIMLGLVTEHVPSVATQPLPGSMCSPAPSATVTTTSSGVRESLVTVTRLDTRLSGPRHCAGSGTMAGALATTSPTAVIENEDLSSMAPQREVTAVPTSVTTAMVTTATVVLHIPLLLIR